MYRYKEAYAFMITIDSKIPEMKTRRLSIAHGEDVFLRARNMYAANPPIRKEWISVLDEDGKHLYYLNYQKNEDVPYIGYSLPADDLWDYDIDHVDLDLSLLERAQVFLFEKIEEYTYAIASILRKYLPDRFIFFMDRDARFFFEEGDCVHFIDSYADLYNRFGYFVKKGIMLVRSATLVPLDIDPVKVLQKRYSSIQVMESIFWKTNKVSFGDLHPEKTFYLIRNPITFEGFVDVVRYSVYRMSMLKKKRGNIIPVIDLGEWGDGNQFTKDGENIWTMFFNQNTNIPLEEVYKSKNVIIADMAQLALNPFLSEEISFQDWKELLKGKFGFKPEIQKSLDEKQGELFKDYQGKRMLAVVGRGSDYTSSLVDGIVRKPIMPEEFLEEVKRLVMEHNFDGIFLATEETRIFNLFKNSELGDRMVSVAQKRIDYEDERFKDKLLSDIYAEMDRDGYKDTLDYLLILYCLSKCDALVATTNCGAYSFPVGLNAGKFEFAYYY